jgi:hypothetical protein
MKSDMGVPAEEGAQGGLRHRQYDIFRTESLFDITDLLTFGEFVAQLPPCAPAK